jgi:hypothetical protein
MSANDAKALDRELGAMSEIVAQLEPLTEGARARVLMWFVLSHTPEAVSIAALESLFEQAKQP